MYTWILIVVIASNGGAQSASVTSTPGFQDAGSCQVAGKVTEQLMKKARPALGGGNNRLQWSCVATKSL